MVGVRLKIVKKWKYSGNSFYTPKLKLYHQNSLNQHVAELFNC